MINKQCRKPTFCYYHALFYEVVISLTAGESLMSVIRLLAATALLLVNNDRTAQSVVPKQICTTKPSPVICSLNLLQVFVLVVKKGIGYVEN